MKRTLKDVVIFIFSVLLLTGCGGGGGSGSSGTQTPTDTDNNQATSGTAAHINFVSATPTLIALKNTGGPPRSETSVLVFEVVDNNDNPVPGQAVVFALSTEIGGLSLSVTEAVTDVSGLVKTTVNSGSVSTEVKVQATIKGSSPAITISSDTLIVSTGLADQNSISLSRETINPEGWHYDNVAVPVIFQAADHFNNFVPDGTVVYFTTELGSIDESCVIKDGFCVINWRSGNPRYSNCGGQPGVSTITAFIIGEESFVDTNGNGYFDAEDTFDELTDMPSSVFRDDNNSGVREECEPFWSFNEPGVYNDKPNGIYNGSLCSEDAEKQGICSKKLVYVRARKCPEGLELECLEGREWLEGIRIVMSGSFATTFTLSPSVLDLRGGGSGTVTLTIADENGNPLPAGSTVKIDLTNGKVFGDSSFEIANTLSQTKFTITIVPNPDDHTTTGIMNATVTTPFGNKTTSSNTVTILDDN